MKPETPPKPLPIAGLPPFPKQFLSKPYRKPKGKPGK